MESKRSYLERAAQLMTSLQSIELQLDDLCRILAMSTLDLLGTKTVYLFHLNADGTSSIIASFGTVPAFIDAYQNISSDTLYPGTYCIKTNETLELRDLHQMEELFPATKGLVNIPDFEGLYAIPIRKFGAPIGSLVVTGDLPILDEFTTEFLELLSLMIATRFGPSGSYIEEFSILKPATEASHKLTLFETLVQRGMSRGFTNKHIASELGYSESAVRQAGMSLFAKLEVSNRADAGHLYVEK